jgi:hypothetical protein
MARLASRAGSNAFPGSSRQGFPSAGVSCSIRRMSSPPGIPAPPRRGLITAGLIVGSLLSLAPLVGMAGTVIGMMNAFQALGTSGAGDTAQLSTGIGEVLVSTVVGLILFVPGVVILTLSIIHYRRAKKRIAAAQTPPQ